MRDESSAVIRGVGGTPRRWTALLLQLGLLLFAPGLAPLRAERKDVVELLNGKRIEGRVVFENHEKVVIRVGSRDQEFERQRVKSVESAAGALGTALERWNAVTEHGLEAALDLARFCASNGLAGEARVFAYLALAEDPTNEEAHLLCEHEKRGKDWVVRTGKKKQLFSKLLASPTDWSDAWEFETTHYSISTNLDLAWACALALELELFYRTFYDWFGAELELYEVVEPMACQIHADKGSFPEVSNRIAYFDGAKNILFELATRGLVLDVLVHEATHQILHNTAVATRKGGGAIPPWVDEGLAEYMSSCREGAPGRGAFDSRALAESHFATHRDAKKPYDLGRILTLATGDFAASSKADLKYAQSYTLVHLCLNGEEGALRTAFLDFLRGAYGGKGSATAFKSAMGIREKELEKRWEQHVGR